MMPPKAIPVLYKNYRGETAARQVVPSEGLVYWGSNEWHPQEQWLLNVTDFTDPDNPKVRDFALKDCNFAFTPKALLDAHTAWLKALHAYRDRSYTPEQRVQRFNDLMVAQRALETVFLSPTDKGA